MPDQLKNVSTDINDKPIIDVTMATSRQGLGVVKELCRSNKYKTRAITRNPKTSKALELAKLQNVQVVNGELLNPQSLKKAFEGLM